MPLFLTTVATAIAIVPAMLFGYWNVTVQRAFWTRYISLRGHVPRSTKSPLPFRLGLGLDEEVVSWLDWEPANLVIGHEIDDPELEGLRQRARRAGWINFASLPFVVAFAIGVSLLLEVVWFIPAVAAFATWAITHAASDRSALRLSRPEMIEVDGLMWAYYVLPAAIVGGTLVLAGLLIAVVQAIRG